MRYATLLLVPITVLLLFAFLPVTRHNAFALDLSEKEDKLLIDMVKEVSTAAEYTLYGHKELIYDIDLNPLGYIYDFSVNGDNGYCIMICKGCDYEIAELYFDAANPYANVPDVGKKVYINSMIYLYETNNDYFIANDGKEIPYEKIVEMRTMAIYAGGGTITTGSDTVYYNSRTENHYNIVTRHPGLTEISSLSNSCAAVAGANLIQFWDRYKTNLIVNYTPGTGAGNVYYYKNSSTVTDAVISQLYTDMGVGLYGLGVTLSQFQGGLSTYCTRQGYSIAFSSCMSSGSFNYTLAKQQLSSGYPVALFLNTFTVCAITENGNNDYLDYIYCSGMHIMIGFGYKEISYSLTGGGTRQDNYIAVASGLTNQSRGYFNINYYTTINDCYGVVIS